MTIKQDSLFCSLPIELVCRIFRNLDAQTIVRSFRLVCKRFYTIVNGYDDFILNFQSISKPDFHGLCNLILPENVKSLTLSDDDETPGQIGYFLSRFRIKQFTQLHTLTVLDIDDCELNIILKDIPKLSLQTLSIDSKQDYSESDISSALSLAIDLRSLRKLNLHISSLDISRIGWPIECTIQHLEMYCRTVDEYRNILYHLPNLRTLVVEGLDTNNMVELMPELANLRPACQLLSLTFKYGCIDMIILEYLLSRTPTLERLRLVQSIDLRIFIARLPQWQTFIETKLSGLTKFEFFFTELSSFIPTPDHAEELIAPFRTPFWTETKRWFAICDYVIYPPTIIFYSPSFYDPQFEYVFQSTRTSRATSTPMINNTIVLDGVRKLHLNVTEVMPSITSLQGGLPRKTVFPKLDRLTLNVTDQWPLGTLRFLSTLIDLSHLTEISLEIHDLSNGFSATRSNIGVLLKLAHNIRSLTLRISFYYGTTQDYNMAICSVVPDHIRHLTVSVSTVYDMRMILHALKYRPSIRFDYRDSYLAASEIHLGWFKHENGYYTYRLDDHSLRMWFDKYANTLSENS